MNDKLLPCPFCGATEPEVEVMIERRYYMVGCNSCGCAHLMHVERGEAIAAWNQRTWQRIEGSEPVLLCWTYHVPEVADDASKFFQAQIYSGGIAFDMDDLDISGTGYEIVKVSE